MRTNSHIIVVAVLIVAVCAYLAGGWLFRIRETQVAVPDDQVIEIVDVPAQFPPIGHEAIELQDENVRALTLSLVDAYFIEQDVLPRAMNGDASAQFQMFRQTLHCEGFQDLFGHDVAAWEAYLTIWYDQLGPNQYYAIRNTLETCGALSELESADKYDSEFWLNASVQHEYPPAIGEYGIRLAIEGGYSKAEKALLTALFSLDPEAVMVAGPALTTPMGSKQGSTADGIINEFAWFIVACELGLDCTEYSTAKTMYCNGNCPQTQTATEAFAQTRNLTVDDQELAATLAAEYVEMLRSGDKSLFSLIAPSDD